MSLQAEEWMRGLHLWRRRARAERNGLWEPTRHELRLIQTWIREQRDDYQRFQRGEPTFLYKEGFDVLTEYGFDWEAEEDEEEELDDGESEEDDILHCLYLQAKGDLLTDQQQHTAHGRDHLWDKNDRNVVAHHNHNIVNDEQLKHYSSAYARYEERWNQKYEELKAYHARHGHIDLPKNDHVGRRLRKWLENQRPRYRSMVHSNSGSKRQYRPMTQMEYEKLSALGVSFSDIDVAAKKRKQIVSAAEGTTAAEWRPSKKVR